MPIVIYEFLPIIRFLVISDRVNDSGSWRIQNGDVSADVDRKILFILYLCLLLQTMINCWLKEVINSRILVYLGIYVLAFHKFI